MYDRKDCRRYKAALINEILFLFVEGFYDNNNNSVVAYDLLANECRKMPGLFRLVWCMFTLARGDQDRD